MLTMMELDPHYFKPFLGVENIKPWNSNELKENSKLGTMRDVKI
jgi:hypothetical protein